MDLKSFLREPIFIDKTTSLDLEPKRLKLKEETYVFIKNEDNIYALKSHDLFSEQQEPLERIIERLEEEAPLKIIPYKVLTSRSLDVLSASVTLVEYEGSIKYLLREGFLLFIMSNDTNNETTWLPSLFAPHPRGLIIVDLNYKVVSCNPVALRILRIPRTSLQELCMDELFDLSNFQYIYNTQKCLINQFITIASSQAALTVDFIPLIIKGVVVGYALAIMDLPSVEEMVKEFDAVKQVNYDLATIISTIYDEIIIVDARGTILRASRNYISSKWQQPPKTLIGQQLSKLKIENELIGEVFSQVIKKKQKVSLMQNNTKSPIHTQGIPVFHHSGKLDRIIIASRDLNEASRLQQELEETRKQSEEYRKELEQLRKQSYGVVPLYASPLMHEVMKEVERVAQFSATVLICGESGVGKEVIATAIHSMGERRDQPLVKINCAAIPETLLESELFGYEKGAFSGANQLGKTGLIVKAHKGCLFLDEISELPPIMQGKLLRAIQEREVYPVGATEPTKFDIQIIAATNKPLADLVAQGKFREDLFYRINVFPIEISPLRERKEDIALLANEFLAQFNQIYQRQLRFSSSSLELLEAYSFPGNVRELQNLVQRIAIRNDGEIIDAAIVERILMHRDTAAAKPTGRFDQIIPLEQAFRQVEEELVTLAMKKYNSTTKAAKALGVSQATISRKYRQILGKTKINI